MPIPKIIHYAWFSDQSMDALYSRCLDSWSAMVPGYQLQLWDSSRQVDSPFFKKMMRKGKWAYASDYIRLFALYHYGGIYLDLDVRLLKKLDSLLQHDCVMGREDSESLACHFMAAAKGHPFIKECLEFYDTSIRLKLGPPPTMPRIINRIAGKYGMKKRDMLQTLNNLIIYPSEYFSPLHYRNRSEENPDKYISGKSYCIHYWHHGWSWLDNSLLIHLKNQPWLFMNINDWRHFFKQLKKRII